MSKRISAEDFLREAESLHKNNPHLEDFLLAIHQTFIVKRKDPEKIQCKNRNCGKEAYSFEAFGWIRIPSIQILNGKKQWKELHNEELYFCSPECARDEREFSTSLPY